MWIVSYNTLFYIISRDWSIRISEGSLPFQILELSLMNIGHGFMYLFAQAWRKIELFELSFFTVCTLVYNIWRQSLVRTTWIRMWQINFDPGPRMSLSLSFYCEWNLIYGIDYKLYLLGSGALGRTNSRAKMANRDDRKQRERRI